MIRSIESLYSSDSDRRRWPLQLCFGSINACRSLVKASALSHSSGKRNLPMVSHTHIALASLRTFVHRRRMDWHCSRRAQRKEQWHRAKERYSSTPQSHASLSPPWISDGTTVRYFTCNDNHGLYCRPGQIESVLNDLQPDLIRSASSNSIKSEGSSTGSIPAPTSTGVPKSGLPTKQTGLRAPATVKPPGKP